MDEKLYPDATDVLIQEQEAMGYVEPPREETEEGEEGLTISLPAFSYLSHSFSFFFSTR